MLPGLADKVIEKTLKVTAERLAPADATIVAERRVPHETKALAQALDEVLKAGAEMVVVFGASAIADTRDVIPAAVEAVGGRIEHFGMPVDPGNLLLVAEANGRPVLGAPGCARSPKENGFDWVLMRLLAGLPIRRSDITGLGVGGLLMEIVTRPQPRAEPAPETGRKVAGPGARRRPLDPHGRTEQAAGRDQRPAAGAHRDRARARLARASPVIVVTGHQKERVERALAGLPVTFVHNPDFAEGLSTSLKAGIAAVPAEADGAIVCLGDMPQVSATLIDRLIAAFEPERGALVVIPTIAGKRGNPVLWARRFFPDLMAVEGDVGARHLIGGYAEAVDRSAGRGCGRADRCRYARGADRGARRDGRLVPFKCFAIPSARGLADGDFVHAFRASRGVFRRACDSDFQRRSRRMRRARSRPDAAARSATRSTMFARSGRAARARAMQGHATARWSRASAAPARRSRSTAAIPAGRTAGRRAETSRARRTSRASSAIAIGGRTCVIRAWVCDSKG